MERAVLLEDGEGRGLVAVLPDGGQLGAALGEGGRRSQAGGGERQEGSSNQTTHHRPLFDGYFIVGMTKLESATSPSGQRAVTVLTLV